jgi:hypothetical protein
MDTSVFHVFKEGQQVMTIDGVPGTVTAVQDGPVAGNENYDVTLINGLGGGQYTASQLTSMGTPTVASEHHLASDDYEELRDILVQRPPIEREATAGRPNEDEPHDSTSLTDPFAWAPDEEDFQAPDLSRQLPQGGYHQPNSGPVQMPAYVDPEWKNH